MQILVKHNPCHDARGRFTSCSGGSVNFVSTTNPRAVARLRSKDKSLARRREKLFNDPRYDGRSADTAIGIERGLLKQQRRFRTEEGYAFSDYTGSEGWGACLSGIIS